MLPAISGDNQGTVLVISAGATSADIRKEVESLLGTKLVTTQDMDELIAAIEKGRDAGAPALVNIEVLYKETVSVTVRDSEIGLEQTIVSNRIHPYFVQLPAASNTVASS